MGQVDRVLYILDINIIIIKISLFFLALNTLELNLLFARN